MADFWDKSEVQRLQDFRAILVAHRRQLIQGVFENRHANKETDPAAGSNRGPELKAMQDQIAAVDSAIEDEKQLEGTARAAASDERVPEPASYPDS